MSQKPADAHAQNRTQSTSKTTAKPNPPNSNQNLNHYIVIKTQATDRGHS